MSAPQTRRSEEEPREEASAEAPPGVRDGEPPAERERESGRPPGADRRGLDYVFKIARVDPRSTLEFEDAADK